MQPGNYNYESVVDKAYEVYPSGKVPEADETNNTYSGTFIVEIPKLLPKPDLTVFMIELNPSAPRKGDEISFITTIKNYGESPSGHTTMMMDIIGSPMRRRKKIRSTLMAKKKVRIKLIRKAI